MPGPRRRRTPSPSLARSSSAPAHAERCRIDREGGGGRGSYRTRGYRGGCGCRVSPTEERPGPGGGMRRPRPHGVAPLHDAGADMGGGTPADAQTLGRCRLQRIRTTESCAERRGKRLTGPPPQRVLAATAAAATYVAAVVNTLWNRNEGAAADGPALSAEMSGRSGGNGRCLRSRPAPT